MKRSPVVLLVVLVVGCLMAVGIWAASLVQAATTGDEQLDRHRWRVVRALAKRCGARTSRALARACMTIIRNESAGRPPPVIGDASLPGGPSVGPMQVYRRTALELGLWSPPPDATSDDEQRDAYSTFANDEDACVDWGVAVLLAKLDAADGDLADAIRRYNGGGPAARAYRDRAVAFADATWGGLDGNGNVA